MPVRAPFLFAIFLVAGSVPVLAQSANRSVKAEPFGHSEGGKLVKVYTVTNANGVELRTMNYGGTILSLRVPDRDGTLEDVVLGFDSYKKYRSDAYLSASPYFGALIGRYANRIDEGRFGLNGKTYQLATNNGPNHLHGGDVGFDKRFWTGHPFVDEHGAGVRYTYVSPDEEEEYPGRLTTSVTYRLTSDNELIVSYEATTTEATPVNLTQHSYFNLSGHDEGKILDHRLMINADHFTPIDSTLIPTGELRSVTGTPFDFRTPTQIGARIDAENRQLRYAQGYDHNFVLNRDDAGKDSLALAARVYDPESGRLLTIRTTEPGLQFYSGNFLRGNLVGKDSTVYRHRSGFALETQHFPDSPNQSAFPSTILRPGETYRSRTIYSFSTRPRD
ncbi:MAG: aldose epimerase family protein [Salinibacter sp.]|uniref:aldose epimerase family protein n=1 Tax=Salinibacter sp. TaxID=2065818 RepID=UPI0035D4A6B0